MSSDALLGFFSNSILDTQSEAILDTHYYLGSCQFNRGSIGLSVTWLYDHTPFEYSLLLPSYHLFEAVPRLDAFKVDDRTYEIKVLTWPGVWK